jgi:hypothetical protein
MAPTSPEAESLNRESQPEVVKKTYSPPSLFEYGSVAKLTQSGNGTGVDGGPIPGMMMVCL